jgi:Uma2 family endonuclease
MPKTAIKLSPADHGRRMSLADFEHADGDGRLYELSRGVVTFMDVPNRPHFRPLDTLRRHVIAYQLARPGRIHAVLGSGECKVLVPDFESERHPDLSLYLTPEPEIDTADIWRAWVPEIVVEIISFGSELRDYVEKRDEYLAIGIKEYRIIDVAKQEMTVLRRRGGKWTKKVLGPQDVYTTRLLPSFELPCAAVLGVE